MFKIVSSDNQTYLIDREILRKYSTTIRNSINNTGSNNINEIIIPIDTIKNDDISNFCKYLTYVEILVELFGFQPEKKSNTEPRSLLEDFFDVDIMFCHEIQNFNDKLDETELLLGYDLMKMIKICDETGYSSLRTYMRIVLNHSNIINKYHIYDYYSHHPSNDDIRNINDSMRQIKVYAHFCDPDKYFKTCISFENQKVSNPNIRLMNVINSIINPLLLTLKGDIFGSYKYYVCQKLGNGYKWNYLDNIDIKNYIYHIIIRDLFPYLDDAGYITNPKTMKTQFPYFVTQQLILKSYYEISPFKNNLCFGDGILYDIHTKDFRIAYPSDYITNTLSVNYADCITKGDEHFKPIISKILGDENYDRFIEDISYVFNSDRRNILTQKNIIIRKNIPFCGETTLSFALRNFFGDNATYVNHNILRDSQTVRNITSSKKLLFFNLVDDDMFYNRNTKDSPIINNIFKHEINIKKIIFIDEDIFIDNLIHFDPHDSYYELSTDLKDSFNLDVCKYYDPDNDPESMTTFSQELGYSIIAHLKKTKSNE